MIKLLLCPIYSIKYPNFDISRRHLSNVINDNNITLKQNVIEEIPKTIFTNIFKGSYERNIEKIKKRTQKTIYKVGTLNFQSCNKP